VSVHGIDRSPAEAEVVPLIERVVAAEPLRAEWNALALEGGSIFATWEWSDVWWKHHGRGRELLLHKGTTPAGRMLAALPLYAWRDRWPRVLRFLGHGPGDELGPVYARGTADAAARCLGIALGTLEWDVFLGEQLRGDEGWTARLGGRTWRRESNLALRVPDGGWDSYLAGRSPNFRQQLRRRRRELDGSGRVRFRLAEEKSLERDLDTLFALHRAGRGSRRTDFADTPFHRELARAALAQGWLRLWLVELDGRPVAAWHGFHVGTIASYYQAGRDPAYERLSVGFVLLAHTIQAAIAEGATEYRFGRGDEEFKFRFTADDPGLETVALSNGVAGGVALAGGAVARAASRLRRAWFR
jgi:CelD/BcsL family acetyltransferase involved in cellulose biosynthesis